MREETKNNNYVGKERETHNIVGLGTIRLWIDLKLLYAVRDNPLSGVKQPGRFGHISPGIFKSIDN
jgi:hypothetical protein